MTPLGQSSLDGLRASDARARPERLHHRGGAAAFWLVALVGLVVAAMLFYLPHGPEAPLSDDWATLAASRDLDRTEILAWLDPQRRGWFRPLSDLYAAAAWRSFGRWMLPHQVVAVGLFSLATIAVAALGAAMAGDRRVGLAAAAVFVTLPGHAEAVLWPSANNELLAGLLAAIALLVTWRYVNRRDLRWVLAGFLAALLAVSAKESALGIPFAVAAAAALPAGLDLVGRSRPTDGSPPRASLPAGRRKAAATAVALTAAACLLVGLRARAGMPYSVSLHPTDLARNLTYSAGIVLIGLPASADRLTFPSADPLQDVEFLAFAMAAASLGAMVVLWIAWRAWRGCAACARALAGGLALLALGLLPGAPVVTERTTYVASLGAAIAAGALIVGLFVSARVTRRRAATVAAALAVAYVVANASAGQARAIWWHRAGAAMARVMSELQGHAAAAPTDARIVVLHLPDRLGPAYAFHNAFPAAAAEWPIGRAVVVGPADAAAVQGPMASPPDPVGDANGPTLYLEYREGKLEPVARPTEPR